MAGTQALEPSSAASPWVSAGAWILGVVPEPTLALWHGMICPSGPHQADLTHFTFVKIYFHLIREAERETERSFPMDFIPSIVSIARMVKLDQEPGIQSAPPWLAGGRTEQLKPLPASQGVCSWVNWIRSCSQERARAAHRA